MSKIQKRQTELKATSGCGGCVKDHFKNRIDTGRSRFYMHRNRIYIDRRRINTDRRQIYLGRNLIYTHRNKIYIDGRWIDTERPHLKVRSGLAEELRLGVELKESVLLNDFQLLKGYIV